MYIGRFFLLLGGVLLAGSIPVIVIFTILYYFYATNRVKREEAVLRKIFGEDYEAYCSGTNRFVPDFHGFNRGSLRSFRWSLFVQNNGHWNLAAVLSGYACLYAVLVLLQP